MNASYRFCPSCATALTTGFMAGRERHLCPGCGWVHWDNPLPVAAALVEHEGRILLARNAQWTERFFGLITGFIERGETPMEAAIREVAEETALRTQEASLIGVYDFVAKNELLIVFHVVTEGTIQLSEELAEYRLIEPARLRPWPGGTGRAVADWLISRGLLEPEDGGHTLEER